MKLTVICVFHNQKDNIEPTLTALYEVEGYPFEVVVINDASNDQSLEVIQSIYDYYQHEHTYVIDHDEPHGKGNSLNEATMMASGEVIWLVDRIDKVHTDILGHEVDRLIASQALCTLMGEAPLPEDLESWVELINNSRLPTNEHFLWKWKSVPQRQRFFSPYQSDFHATEAAIRIGGRDEVLLGENAFMSRSTLSRMASISANRAEILMSLFRERKLTIEQSDLLMSQLKLKEKKLTVDTGSRSMGELLDEARAFLNEGYNIDALEICNRLLEKYSDNLEVLTLKVQVLNRLNRYVEASELKHSVQQRLGYDLNIPKVVERRLIDRTPEISTGETAQNPPSGAVATPGVPGDKMSRLLTQPPDDWQPAVPPAILTVPPSTVEPVQTTPPAAQNQPIDEPPRRPPQAVSSQYSDLDDEYDFPQAVPIKQEHPQDYEQEHDQTFHEEAPEALEPVDEQELPHTAEASKPDQEAPGGPLISIIIPTASARKVDLQNCLISIANYMVDAHIEIIVVDNASLDDTFEYLEQLERNDLFPFKTITNKENKGFAFAVNQGIEASRGEFICVLHNDVVLHNDAISLLVDALVTNPNIAVVGPVLSESHNTVQTPALAPEGDVLTEVDYIDSACMVIRASSGLRFSTAYGLAWFEDKDLCRQASESGMGVALVSAAFVEHVKGTTTDDLGVEFESKLYWNNKAAYDKEWDLVPIPGAFVSEDPVMELVAIGHYLNPWHPEEELADRARHLLTSETRTLILRSAWDYDSLSGMMQLLMVIEARDLLRSLEDKLTAFELLEPLCYRLVTYYYERSIYSRCLFYLSELTEDRLSFRLRLLRLRIAVNERKVDVAVPLVQELYDYSPHNPEVMRLLGELHKHEGNLDEAEHWYRRAKQTDPVSYEHLRV